MSASLPRVVWVLLHAAVTFLAFPHPLGDRVIDLGWLMAWGVPLTAAAAVQGLSIRRAAWIGFWVGLLANGAVLHWAYVVTVHYGHAPVAVGVLAPFGMAAYSAVFHAAWSAAFAGLAGRGRASPWALAACWAALDHGRTFLLTGFTWASLGYAQHESPLLALAPFTGVVGLTFVTVLGAFGALALVRPTLAQAWGGGGRPHGFAALALVVLAGTAAWLGWEDTPEGEAVEVAVLQGNIQQGVKWSPDWAERTLGIYDDLTRQAAARGARVIAWPETAVPGSPDGDPELADRLVALAAETRATLIVGAIGLSFGADEREPPQLFDSAFVVTPDGIGERYDKAHLVPFGEYLPLRPLLGRFIRAIATGSAGRDVTRGAGPRALVLEGSDAPLPVGVPICYELLFPDEVRRFAASGGRMLFALTNDAWYGRTGAPHQFLAITALRAAETGLWVARSANTGVSALIDGRGRVRARTAIFETDLLVGAVPLRPPGAEPTFYVRHGDLFAWTCWALALGCGFLAMRTPGRAADA
ncbi:MAG: apolipoprotein N-acyltransferase [Deltaproteobacteria bacterium]|nr:apolipoprotein N-acyltransferase [Deltaproteobacteria bacterium]